MQSAWPEVREESAPLLFSERSVPACALGEARGAGGGLPRFDHGETTAEFVAVGVVQRKPLLLVGGESIRPEAGLWEGSETLG